MSQDGIDKVTEKAPNGFDWSQLVADFESMGERSEASRFLAPASMSRLRLFYVKEGSIHTKVRIILDNWPAVAAASLHVA